MKVLTVSDVELPQMRDLDYLRGKYSDVSLLVSCGDMPPDYLEFITSVLYVPLAFVRGNHDTRYVPDRPGGDDLHLRIRKYEGYTFAGLEGSICYNKGRIQYTEAEMFRKTLRLLSRMLLVWAVYRRPVDVLVTHSPPKGIHDIPDDYAHRGFRSFRWLMRWARPRYLIHGHVDTWDRRQVTKTAFCHTTVINVNPVSVLTLDRTNTR
ncbi:MAG: metallophosphoesterase family protein [Anaerolineae bacterium]|nr:metallophosphoesterase family protein [Anaerolineae bacterium]